MSYDSFDRAFLVSILGQISDNLIEEAQRCPDAQDTADLRSVNKAVVSAATRIARRITALSVGAEAVEP